MKKSILHIVFGLTIAGFILTSCEDMFGGFLDKQPSNELTGKQTFSNWSTTTEFHFDTYNFLRHLPYWQFMDGCSNRFGRNQLF